MSRSAKPKKIVHPRQRPCPDCGARPGEPCVLRTGKPLREVHCTIRLTGYPVEGTWKPPQHGSHRETSSLRTEAVQVEAKDNTTGVPNKNAGQVAQSQPVQNPDGPQDHEPDPETPAGFTPQGPVGTPPGAAPTEPATSTPSGETTPGADTDEDMEPQRDVFDTGSNLFQSGKPGKKKTRKKKEEKEPARVQAEPSLF